MVFPRSEINRNAPLFGGCAKMLRTFRIRTISVRRIWLYSLYWAFYGLFTYYFSQQDDEYMLEKVSFIQTYVIFPFRGSRNIHITCTCSRNAASKCETISLHWIVLNRQYIYKYTLMKDTFNWDVLHTLAQYIKYRLSSTKYLVFHSKLDAEM